MATYAKQINLRLLSNKEKEAAAYGEKLENRGWTSQRKPYKR